MAPRIDIKLQQLQYDGYVSRIGQMEAERYLAAREQPPTRGNIRTCAHRPRRTDYCNQHGTLTTNPSGESWAGFLLSTF